jgi:cytochrome c553
MNRVLLSVFVIGLAGIAADAYAAGVAPPGMPSVKRCAACHGDDGEGVPDKGGALAGEDPKKFVAAMNRIKSGDSKSEQMKKMAPNYSDADVEKFAAYYASMKK